MKKYCLILIITLVAFKTFGDIDLPEAPNGYRWLKILNEQSALLQPYGWFFKKEQSNVTDAFFITKENIEDKGGFTTGLSLNVIYNIKKKTNLPPSKYVLSIIQNMKESIADEVLAEGTNNQGPFTCQIFRIKDKRPDGIYIIIHYFFLANDHTGTLWMFSFEAPEKYWNEEWKIGTVLLNYLAIESEI